MASKAPTPEDRHQDDPCRIAYDQWWLGLTRQGDPMHRYDLVGEAFEAGWQAAMNEMKEAEAFLRKIRDEERREERRAKEWDSRNAEWGKT